MELTERLDFDDDDRRDVYEFIEGHGSVREDRVRRALNLDSEALGHHVTVLRRDGYVRKAGDRLEVAYAEGEPTEHATTDDEPYVIRPAEQADLDGLVALIRRVAEEGTYIEAETVASVVDHEEVVLRHNQLGSRMVFVAVLDGEVVGWVHLELPEAEKLRHTAKLTVGVEAADRGRGIGATLLSHGEEWARERDFEKLYNSVPNTNQAAIRFLTDHGWETEAVREDHYKIDGDYVHEVMMARELA